MATNKESNNKANKPIRKKVNYPYATQNPKDIRNRKQPKKASPSTSKGKAKPNKKVIKKKKRSLPFRIFKWTFWSLFFIGLTVFVIGLGYMFAILKSTPTLDVEAIKNLSEPTSFYDSNGSYMDNLNSEINRNKISYEEMPQYLKDAYVSIEDQRFYKHNGIDIKRILGSLVTDVKKIFTGQTGMHGGSTITQQLLKNTVLSNEKSDIERKIKEIYLATELEKQLNKDEILELYLNTIPLGGTTYGVEAASKFYFNKSCSELNLIECAYIAGVTQAPTTYGAYTCTNPETYKNRTKTVLGKMYELKKINKEDYEKGLSDIDNGGLVFQMADSDYSLDYEWYINPTIQEVKKDLIEKYKYTEDEVSKLLANGGLKIYTNMDRSLQDYAQQILNETTINNGEALIEGSNTPAFQGAATIVNYHTGEVLAIIGGRGEHSAQSTNRAYSELRSIGSSTKPLTVYGPAINERVFTSTSIINDSPISESIGKKYPQDDGKPYNPQNDNFQCAGNITLRHGLKESKNIVAVLVEDSLGLDVGKSYGEKFGLKYNSTYTGISTLALGQFHCDPADPDGGTPYILASAFGTFGNGGLYTEPNLYSKVEDANGNTLLSSELNTTSIFSEDAAYIMYDMLKGSRSYTGPYAQWGAMPVAGKTGTTTNSKDLWFSGVTPYLSASVWLGYYDSSVDMVNKYGVGSSFASQVWGKIMEKAHEGLEVKDIEVPSTLVTATICTESGKLASSSCYTNGTTLTDFFIRGTQPTTYCTSHNIVKEVEDDDNEDKKDKDDKQDTNNKDDNSTSNENNSNSNKTEENNKPSTN